MGLILGAVRRTGPIVWVLPYSANLTLRQMGLILLLAGIGIRSGYTFVTTFQQSGGVSIFVAGAIITTTTAFLTLWVGYKVIKNSLHHADRDVVCAANAAGCPRVFH